MKVGIDKIRIYGGSAKIDVIDIFHGRSLNIERFPNLMLKQKALGFPFEDAVTNGVNAAVDLLDSLSSDERSSVKTLITASESAVDFGKSLSTFMFEFLDLPSDCRLFEVKQACYSLTAALQMAVDHLCCYPDEKVLIVGTDIARSSADAAYGEPSQGCGAAAVLLSRDPELISFDIGAYGNHSVSEFDSYRPNADEEMGDADLSLMTYLDCMVKSYQNYKDKISDHITNRDFSYFIFHTPFGGLVKGAHRRLVTSEQRLKKAEIDADFTERVLPSLHFNQQIGNLYCSAVYVALFGLLSEIKEFSGERRIGIYSYGSGSCSEFFSGVISSRSVKAAQKVALQSELDRRYPVSFGEYVRLIEENRKTIFGLKDFNNSYDDYLEIYRSVNTGKKRLYISEITQYKRKYKWI